MQVELLWIGGTERGGQVWMAYQWAKAIEETASPKEREELEKAITRVCRVLAPVFERALAEGRGDALPTRPEPPSPA